MITIYSYDIAEGTLSQPTAEELTGILDRENIDVWVDLEDPTPVEAELILTKVFDFHELAVEECTAVDYEEAKLDDYETYLFLVTHSIHFNLAKHTFEIVELDLFFGRHYVVTHHKKPTPGIRQLKRRLEKNVDFMSGGTDEIMHAVIDSLVDNYMITFKEVERTIYDLESQILSGPSKETFNDLFRLKRSLINLKRVMTPMVEVADSLGNAEHELIQEENTVYFQDVHDHVSNIEGRLQNYLEMVSGTMDTYVSLSQYRMNTVMKTLTIIATVVLIPTLIASVYGMNLDYMPFAKSEHGFEIIMGFCAVIVLSMLLFFKIKDWF